MPIFPSFFVNKTGAYEIEQSLRFDGTSRLTRTPSSTSNTKTWTWSSWVKRSGFGANGMLWSAHEDLSTNADQVRFLNGDFEEKLCVFVSDAGEAALQTSAVYRDPSAWMHVVIRYDTTQATAANRIRIYVNGSETPLSTNVYPSQDYAGSAWNRSGEVQAIGCNARLDGTDFFNGYMSEVHLVDGTSLDPDNFGEYDDNGVWRPIKYTGSYGTNGFYLKFDPSATNGIGHDHSGNGNNFTANNFTTSGTGTDVMSDTPTTNYCTWNPITTNSSGVALSEGNLFAAHAGSNDYGVIGTIGVTSGKWYWEGQLKNFVGFRHLVGVTHSVEAGNPNLKDKSLDTGFWGSRINSGSTFYILENGSQVNTSASYPGSTPSSDSIMQFALDLDNLKWYIGFDGNWYNSGDPAAGTNATSTGLTSGQTWLPICELRGDEDSLWNFGQRAFAYTPPTGFNALNTSNLPAPTVKDGSDYFNTVLYTGTGSARSITGVGFQPDLVWFKIRSSADSHALYDAVRGVQERLQADSTAAEGTQTQALSAFDSDGWSMGTDSQINGSSSTYVAWNWKANGSTSSNTDGSITSTVSANPTAGFSIVSYTGNGGVPTVGHGLGVAPSFIIAKNRDTAGGWGVYHKDIGATHYLRLDSTLEASDDIRFWNDTAPTSTVVQLGTLDWVNGNGDDIIMYCFAEVEGYSKFGSFVGNSSDDGVFIYLGFKPKWLLLKSAINTADDWIIMDVDRSPYNVMNDHIVVQQSAAEVSNSTETNMDFLSNGIKLRDSNGKINASGSTYIYAAFAENPFGGSGISPATAR